MLETKTLLPLALTYLSRGYSVIICGADKRPILPWKEFSERRATPEELVKWFFMYPDAQVGIVTGKISNLTVIDLEKDADFTLVKDETYRVKTGGAGVHVYCKYDESFSNAVKILPNIDIRNSGGFVVAAGSTTTKGSYLALNNLEVMEMTPETKKLLLGAISRKLPLSTPEVGGTLYPRVSTEGLDYQGSFEGGRNDSMTKFAGAIHAKLHPSLWSTIGLNLFEQANQKNNPPLGWGELRTIWNSIGNREVSQNPGGRTYHQPKTRTWGPSEDLNQDVIQDVPKDSEGESEIPVLDPKETLHASEVASLQKIDSEHTYSLDMAPFDEALLGGLSLGELVVVAGQSGHGKTTLIQDWTVTLSSGGQTQKEKLPTLWFSYEVLAKPLWIKFQGMGATVDTPIYLPRFNETGETEWVIDVIEKAIVKWGIKVVAVDHIGFLRAPKGNYANAADAITHTVRALKRLAVKRGLIILLPVHVRKTSAKTPDLNDIRDSLGIAQEADTVFFIGREKDEFGLPSPQAKLSLIKNRKTGVSVSAMFDFQFNRYFYNAGDSQGQNKTIEEVYSSDSVKDYNDF